jgi:tetratricopeptide (TPR) repeat protein
MNSMTRVPVLILAAATLGVLSLGRPVSAQDWKGNGRFEGTVVDEEDSKPIAGVQIKAECPERGGGTTVKSDKKGRWVVGGVVACNWNLDFIAEGYETKKVSVNLPAESARLGQLKVPLKRSGPPPELRAAAQTADEAYKTGRFADARAAYEKVLAARPDLAPMCYQQIGFSYIQEKQYDKALEYLDKVLAAEPGSNQIRAIAAQAALEGKMVDRARQYLAALDDTKITNPDMFYNVGVNFLNAGETADAIEYFGKTIALDPKHVEAYYRRGLAYLGQGKNDEARADFEKVIELQPEGEMATMSKKALDVIK